MYNQKHLIYQPLQINHPEPRETHLNTFNFNCDPCKAEQPLRGMELQEKEAQKDKSTQEICLENLQLKDVC